MTDPYRHFYEHHSPDLSAITDLSHRHFRFLLPRGCFLKLQDRVRSAEVLRRWLVRYRPSDVYYSTSCWLVPENLGRRERTPLSDNIFLSSDVVFDIDRSPFSTSSLELARQDTLRLLRFCDENQLDVKYTAFSGSKGFHVVCADPVRYPDPSPFVREDRAKAVRREIVHRVLAEGICVDARITPDTRRIIRVPGTINSKTGYVCTLLSREQLEEPISTILKYVPRVNAGTPLIPARGDDCPLRGARIISWLCHRFGVRSGPDRHFSYSTFLVSSVPGTQLQVPLFLFPRHCSIEDAELRLSAVQQQYGLSDICLYRSPTGIAAICLRTFPLRRLEKIIKASGSLNYGTLVRYKQLFFRVGEVRGENGDLIAGPPEYVKTIPGPGGNNAKFVSLPHYRFLKDFTPVLREYPRMHGEGTVILTHTVNEDERGAAQ
jgi:DNA primase catalytic subunit